MFQYVYGPALSTAINNLQADKAQDEREYQQWLRYQQYNTPANQMARLQEAGLNPNLIYGSSGATSSIVSMPHRDQPSNNNAELAMNFLSAYQQILNGQKQRELLDEQIKNLKVKEDNGMIKSIGMTIDNAIKDVERRYKEMELKYLQDHGTIRGQNVVNGTMDRVETVLLQPVGKGLGNTLAGFTTKVGKFNDFGVKLGAKVKNYVAPKVKSIFKYMYDKSLNQALGRRY